MRGFAIGFLAGIFIWAGYRQLSFLDPFQAHGLSGYLFVGLAGGALYITRLRPILWAIAGALAFMILVVVYTPIVERPTHAMIRADSLSGFDAVVVLSSNVSTDDLIDQQGLDRLLTGFELARKFGKPLVITATRIKGGGRFHYSSVDQARITALAGYSTRILTTGLVTNTRDEATETLKAARREGWQRVALVTSPLHTRRACTVFEKTGLQVVCVPSISRDLAVNSLLTPNDRLRAFQLWLYESLATSEYKRRGWI